MRVEKSVTIFDKETFFALYLVHERTNENKRSPEQIILQVEARGS